MATKTTLVEILHDTGYGEDVLFYLNLALRGKDMRAIRVVDVSVQEKEQQRLADAWLAKDSEWIKRMEE